MNFCLAVLALVASASAGHLNYGVGSLGVAPAAVGVDYARTVGVAHSVAYSSPVYQAVHSVPAVHTVPAVSTYSVAQTVPAAVQTAYAAPVAGYGGWNQGGLIGGFLKKK